jgi:hypothetical protein
MGYDQVPELTSSRLIDVNKTMYIVPPGATGSRRAILIGINYTGQQGQLSGCHNDCTLLSNVHTSPKRYFSPSSKITRFFSLFPCASEKYKTISDRCAQIQRIGNVDIV